MGLSEREAECENRTYQTWWEQVSGWFYPPQWDCRGLVSDGAKALVKLALSGLDCPSLPDVFHLMYTLPQINGYLEKPVNGCNCSQQHQALQAKLKVVSSDESSSKVEAQITLLQAQQQGLETDHQDYQQSLHALSQAIHPFDLKTGESQFGLELPARLQAILAKKRATGSNLCTDFQSICFGTLATAVTRPIGDNPCLVAVGAPSPLFSNPRP